MQLQVHRRYITAALYGVPAFFVFATVTILALLFNDHVSFAFVLISVFTSELLVIILVLFIVSRTRGEVERVETANQELMAFGDRYLHLYRSSPVPYIHVNTEGVVTLSNIAARRMIGIKEHKLIGLPLLEYLHHSDETTKSIIANKIKTGTSFADVEMVLRSGSGNEKWVTLSGYTFSKSEDMFITMTDITQKKKIDKAKTEFVSMAAHQLRTPLTASNMALSMLEENTPDKSPQQEEYFTVMRRSILRLLVLVDDFLNVSKFETGSFASSTSEVAIHDELPEIINQYQSRIREKRLAVNFSVEPETIFIKLDKRLLRMVIGNLISNATKYSREMGELTVTAVAVNDTLQITVADTGLGIPLSDQPMLFQKFHRAQNVQTEQIKGNGLGLYIVKEALELMNGNISFQSEENKGTTFTVTLPIY